MIVRCPACHRGYRLDDAVARRRRSLRCSACKHEFASEPAPPEEAAAPFPAAPSPAPESAPTVSEAGKPAVPADPGTGVAEEDVGCQVLLADAARPFRGVVKPLLDELGCRVTVADGGIDAFRLAVARRPQLLIASVHLAGLSGVAICEGVKGSPHLKAIKVALVGSALSSDLFNRETAMAYGADLFLDEGMSPEALRREIGRLLGEARTPDTGQPASPPPEPRSDAVQEAVGPDEEIGVLARLMLSDLRLYYPDRYEQAVREGRLFEVFSDELTKGRAMLDERYPEVADRHKILAAALRDSLETGTHPESSSSDTRTG